MINDILVSLMEYLKSMLKPLRPSGIHVALDSVSRDKDTEPGDLLITLLRIEEETSRKPQNVYFTLEKGVHYPTSPDIDINLEVLISSPAPKYETALLLISEVIRILNSIKTVPKPEEMTEESFQRINAMSISMMGLSFDQSLSMWQTLGGTLVPFVVYKIRMLTMPGIPDTTAAEAIRKTHVETGGMDTRGKKPESLPKEPESLPKEPESLPKEQDNPKKPKRSRKKKNQDTDH